MPRPTTAEQLATLTAIVQRMDQRAEEDRAERKAEAKMAQESREKAQAEMLRHGQQIESQGDDILRIDNRLKNVEIVAKMADSYKAKVVGAVTVLGFLGSIILLGLTFFKDKILALLGWS